MPGLKPLLKPNMVKKRTKKFIRHQTGTSKLSTNGRIPEALTMGYTEDSRARTWHPTLVTGATRNKAHAAQ